MSNEIANDYKIYFAGLARDCEDTLEENFRTILHICRKTPGRNCKIFIAENDSQDKTRKILEKLENKNSTKLFLFDNLDEEYPIREERIAYLRQFLFEEIQSISRAEDSKISKLYVPIDLDSKIAQSIDTDQFLKECHRIINGETNAVFPVSKPYYYDIYALRAEGWVEDDCWKKVRSSRTYKGSVIPKVKYIYSKQKHIEKLSEKDSISVQSAFGGVGIYNLEKLSGASYKQDGKYPQNMCEHVFFNKSVDSKEISTDFIIQAPKEHIKYKLSYSEKVKIIIKSILSDIKRGTARLNPPT